jgi:hypothetical protein
MGMFLSQEWVLLIDDRMPDRRQIAVMPLKWVAKMTFF